MQFVRPAIRSALASRAPSVALRSAPAAALRPVVASQAAPSWIALSRAYSAGAGLSKDGIQERIFEVIKSFEKVDPSKVSFYCPTCETGDVVASVLNDVTFVCSSSSESLTTLSRQVSAGASFTNDLGLDSLDAVEVVMAYVSAWPPRTTLLTPTLPLCSVEEEFAIEIPDEEADKITTVGEGKHTATALWQRLLTSKCSHRLHRAHPRGSLSCRLCLDATLCLLKSRVFVLHGNMNERTCHYERFCLGGKALGVAREE